MRGCVGGEFRARERLHLGENGGVLLFILPWTGEVMGRAIGGIGDGDHLLCVFGDADEPGDVRVVSVAVGAVLELGAVRIVIERGAGSGHGGDVVVLGLFCILGRAAAKGGAVGVVGGVRGGGFGAVGS